MTGRSSTRLHAPPGGTSQAGSLIFGGSAPQEDRFGGRGRRSNPVHQQQQSTYQQSQQQTSFANKEQFSQQNIQQQQQPVAKKQTQSTNSLNIGSGHVSANAFASGTNQNCGNFMTDRPTSRVLAPPGGRSSGPLW